MRKQSNSKIMMRNKYLYFHICNLDVLLDISIEDQLPIELDGLAKWHLGERMLTARLTGADPAGLRAA